MIKFLINVLSFFVGVGIALIFMYAENILRQKRNLPPKPYCFDIFRKQTIKTNNDDKNNSGNKND